MPPSDRTREIVADLTAPQREAVCYGEGPLLVVAGAGSGKTRVITRRIAYLVEQGVPPDRILAVTFTNKAADEMRRRVEALVGKEVWMSTFHSFCARLLRREIAALGRDPSFTIYDQADSLRLIRQAVKELDLDPSHYSPAGIQDFIGLSKDRVQGVEDAAREALGFVEQNWAAVYRRYEEKLEANNALDFDDLLLKTLEVFRRRPEALQHYQRKYLHVLVDEYQDTNLPQHLIARALQGKHRNITAVGDPDQMIYTWRGARMENLMEFEQDFPGAHVVTLERNYRSSGSILRAASACISHNVFRRPKDLYTERDAGADVIVSEFADAFAEGRWVAQRTSELVAEGLAPRDVAVFYRTKSQSLPLEDAFASAALAHQTVDSVGFFERREVKDLRSYLQLLLNARDAVACLRVINTPPRGIGDKTVAQLQAAAERGRKSLLETVRDAEGLEGLSARARMSLAAFWALYQELVSLDRRSASGLLRKVLERTSYLERQPLEEREDAEEVVDMFLGYARQYDERSPGGGLEGFLEQAALVSDVDGWNAQASAVPFMTLHSAKGLEFDAVFIVGVEEDILPHRRSVEEHVHDTQEAALEEERRLFYVGMTRARHRLFITHACKRTVRGHEETVVPSRFLAELPAEGVQWSTSARPEADAAASGFGADMADILKRKRTSLRVVGGKAGLAKGARVSHPLYGEGEVIESMPLAKRWLVRVDFQAHGVLTLVLAADEVAKG